MSTKPFEDGLVEGCASPVPLVLRRGAGRTEPDQVPPCLATISLQSRQPPRVFTHSRKRCSGYSI